MKTSKKVLTVVLSIILWLVILLAALFAFTTLATRDINRVGNLAGFTPLSVMSDSMSPTFKQGDLIIIRKCDPTTLKEGDIITFHTIIQNEYTLNTHRIDSISEKSGIKAYVTKGDNNQFSDTHMIGNSDIVGKYVGRLPGFGKVIDFLSSSTGFLVCIVLPMLVFFAYQVYHLIMVSISLKKATALEAAQEAAQAAKPETDAKLTETEAELEAARKRQAELEARLAELEKQSKEEKQ
jgi:signal peptidase